MDRGRASASPSPSERQGRGFMRLPRELRDVIYELTLVAEEPIELTRLKHAEAFDERMYLCPALLRLSWQVYNETRPVLYGLNTFRATIAIHCFGTNDFSTSRLLQRGVRPVVPSTYQHPGLPLVRRVANRLHPTHDAIESSYDPCFADNILRALVLHASPDVILFEPIDFDSYWQLLAHSDVEWADIQTALVVAESQDIADCLLGYARLGLPKILVLASSQVSVDFESALHSPLPYTWQNLTIASELPARFARTGQLGKRGKG